MPPVRPRFLYSGIRVRNVARSLRFYRALGFRLRRRGTMEHGGVWIHLEFPGHRHWLELNFYPRSNRFYEPFRRGTEFDHFGFYVPDMELWTRWLRRHRIPIVAEFSESSQRLVYVRDPDGVWLEYFGPVRPRRRRTRRAAARPA